MALTAAERDLPQFCYIHDRRDYHSFRADEGRFLIDHHGGTVFACYECLGEVREEWKPTQQIVPPKGPSPWEIQVVKDLRAAGLRFKRRYRVCGSKKLDLAFPDFRLAIEFEVPDCLTFDQHRKNASRRKTVQPDGWRVANIPIGSDTVTRILQVVEARRNKLDRRANRQPWS